ncbi:ammonium transporter [Metallumcola ferriviriculae]|uniref:Ammonium transporter n=1 Tax=Metallumcola ferriviriculae TaxID=3039180 RepID=A0AAU0USL8_9FIRM|nr:ammonium transporter [Desulfitibacteraceae bacterium MK1]
MKRFLMFSLLVCLMLLLIPGMASAADGISTASNAVAIDTVWTLIAAFLVFIMQAGFAMVEAGFTRAKNAANIIMKNVMDFVSGTLVFWLVGFGLAFGVSTNGLFGSTGFMINDGFDHLGLGIPLMAFVLFQTMFCATAATIVSGAMAERTKFAAYFAYSIVISGLIYPVVVHWVWGGGWLAQLGFVDFAGSTVVHSLGGWAGLVGAKILGPRVGKYSSDGKSHAIPGHNLTLGALGVFLLWFGWFGFNPGSTISGTTPDIAAIAMTTNLSAAAGAFAAMIYSWVRHGKPDVSLTLNGALGGLVGITAGTASVSPGGALIIGLIAGVITLLAVEIIDKVFKIDDPVGAVAVHGMSGVWGTLAVGLFATDGGLFYGGGLAMFEVQAIGVIAVLAWTLTTTVVLFKAIDIVIGLRVTEEEEVAGLDIGEHAIEAYGDFMLRAKVPTVE